MWDDLVELTNATQGRRRFKYEHGGTLYYVIWCQSVCGYDLLTWT